MILEEIWRDISGFDDNYQISNTGKVKSKERIVSNACRTYLKKEQILKNQVMKDGYSCVVLRESGKKKLLKIHRLVATAFIPNPTNLPCINHIDGDKLNNQVENLEWCTFKYNTNHAIKNGLKPLVCGRNIQKVFQLNCGDLAVSQVFDNIAEASKIVGCNESSIYAAIVRKRPYKGFFYIREDEYSEDISMSYFRETINRKHRISIDGEVVSATEYSKITGIPRGKVYKMIKNGEIESEVVQIDVACD